MSMCCDRHEERIEELRSAAQRVVDLWDVRDARHGRPLKTPLSEKLLRAALADIPADGGPAQPGADTAVTRPSSAPATASHAHTYASLDVLAQWQDGPPPKCLVCGAEAAS